MASTMFPRDFELSTELLHELFEQTTSPADFIMTHNRNILAIENQLLVNQSQINKLIQTIQFVQNIHNHQLRHSLVKIQTKYQAYVNLIAEFTNKRREYFLKMMDIISNKQKLLKQIARTNVREFYNPVKSWVSGGVKNRENIAILRSFLELSLNYTRYRDSRSILNQRLNTLYKAVGDLQTSIMKAIQNFVSARVTVDFNKIKSNSENLLDKLVLHENELYNNEKDLFKVEKQYRDAFGLENDYVTMLAPYIGRVNNLFLATTSGGGNIDLGGGDAQAILSSSAIIPELRAGDVHSMAGLLHHQLKSCTYALNRQAENLGSESPSMIRNILNKSDVNEKMNQLVDIVANGQLALTTEIFKQVIDRSVNDYKGLPDKSNNRLRPGGAVLQWGGNTAGGAPSNWYLEVDPVGRVEALLGAVNTIADMIATYGYGNIDSVNERGIYNNRRQFNLVGGGPAYMAQLQEKLKKRRSGIAGNTDASDDWETDPNVAPPVVQSHGSSAAALMHSYSGAPAGPPTVKPQGIPWRASKPSALRIIDDYSKYATMLKKGVPEGGVEQIMRRQGVEPSGLGPWVAANTAAAAPVGAVTASPTPVRASAASPTPVRASAASAASYRASAASAASSTLPNRHAQRQEPNKPHVVVDTQDLFNFGDQKGAARTKIQNKTRITRKYKSQKGGAQIPAQIPINDSLVYPTVYSALYSALPITQDYNKDYFRPLVRPDILIQTLVQVVNKVSNSELKNVKTYGGESNNKKNVMMRYVGTAAANTHHGVIDLNKLRQRRTDPTVANAGDEDSLYFSTVGEFAKHVGERLQKVRTHLDQLWKVHDIYNKNIDKIKNLSDAEVEHLWENMNSAAIICITYDNYKPLERIGKLLNEKKDDVQTKVNTSLRLGALNVNVHNGTRLWKPEDNNA
jgi:hypothetical protein